MLITKGCDYMIYNSPVQSYKQLGREEEEYYEEMERKYEEYKASIESFYDDYDEIINNGERYLDIDNGLFSLKTLKDLYDTCKSSGKSVYDFIKSVYGNNFEYPVADEDKEYYKECYDNGSVLDICDSLSWQNLKTYNI